jgi:protein involved in polysaccharide export with SLBB domain
MRSSMTKMAGRLGAACAAVALAILVSGVAVRAQSGAVLSTSGGAASSATAPGEGAAGPYAAPAAPAVGSAPGAYGPGAYVAPAGSAAAGSPVTSGIGAPGAPAAVTSGALPASLTAAPVPAGAGAAAGSGGVNASSPPVPASGLSVTNLAAAAAKASPEQINAAMQELGISPNEAMQIQQQLAAGVINPQEVRSLCAHLAASNISPAMVESVAGTIGLNADQFRQVQECLPGAGGPGGAAVPAAILQNGAGVAGQGSGAAAVSSGAPSLIERNYSQLDLQVPPPNPSPVSLAQFGYSIFAGSVSSFAPVANFPVGPDYVIGPGDQLNIYMWGRLNQTSTVTVDRDGSVEISGIEPLQVGGLTFEQAKKLIEGRVSQISNLNVHVTMGPLRTIQVLVVGAVNQPGSYTISPMSRVSNALIAAGGVAKIGSLREVELRRGNQVVKRIDYYNLLLRGDNSDDVFLQTNDVVFVPPIGPVVGVVGDVQRPAIYELHRNAPDIRAAIKLAAGTSPFADTERVQVERVDHRRRLVVLDVPYGDLGWRRFTLHDGDLVKVFHMLTMHRDVVQLTGNVQRPGEFQWRPNMRVSDLVAQGGGVAKHTSFKYAVLRRMMYPTMRQRVIQVNLQQAMFGDPHNPSDLELEPLDELDIFSEDALRQAPVVQITGEVQMPGSYALSPGMRLSDLVNMAGGLKNNADFSRIQIDRTEIVDGSKTRFVRLYGNLHKTAAHPVNDPLLVKDDQVYVTVATGWHPPWVVTVKGEVMRPGSYPIHRNERLSDLLLSCGGFTSGAFPKGIVFTRQSVQQVEQQRLQQSVEQLRQGLAQFSMFEAAAASSPGGGPSNNMAMMANLQNLLIEAQTQQATGRMVVHVDDLNELVKSADDVVLQDGDSVAVPLTPASVNVLGSVNEPSSITAQPGWTVREYLYKAGGPTLYADKDSIMVVKADGTVITQGGINAAHPFPFSSVVSGGLMGLHLQAGDTIYVPPDVQTFVKTQYALSISTIVAHAAQSMAIVAILARSL